MVEVVTFIVRHVPNLLFIYSRRKQGIYLLLRPVPQSDKTAVGAGIAKTLRFTKLRRLFKPNVKLTRTLENRLAGDAKTVSEHDFRRIIRDAKRMESRSHSGVSGYSQFSNAGRIACNGGNNLRYFLLLLTSSRIKRGELGTSEEGNSLTGDF